VCASDETAARIDELQFSLGEGPRWEVVRTGRATIIPNLAQNSHVRWPIFGEAVLRLGVGALLVYPLDTTATEALMRLKAHAFAANQTLEEVARSVVTRRLDFRDVPE
jgi:hypothetical protein